MITEREIQEAFKRTATGKAEAFEPIAKVFRPSMTRYVNTIVRDPELSRDLVQDTFLKVIEKAGTFRGESSVKTWMFTIARNLAYAHLRRKQLHEKSMTVMELGVNAGWGSYSDPEKIASLKEESKILHEALGALTPEDREIILLRDIEGNSGAETSEILELSLATMKTRLHRARLKLLGELKTRLDR